MQSIHQRYGAQCEVLRTRSPHASSSLYPLIFCFPSLRGTAHAHAHAHAHHSAKDGRKGRTPRRHSPLGPIQSPLFHGRGTPPSIKLISHLEPRACLLPEHRPYSHLFPFRLICTRSLLPDTLDSAQTFSESSSVSLDPDSRPCPVPTTPLRPPLAPYCDRNNS